jgi:ATP-dependent Clp protease protease subunit
MLPHALLKQAHVRLFGTVDYGMLDSFMRQLAAVQNTQGPLLLELTTLGGEADTARRIAEDIRLFLSELGGDLYFVGKTAVYSAGMTIMSAFPVERRFLSADATLLIHERKMDKPLNLSGPLRACEAVLRDVLHEIENGRRLENDDFRKLVTGANISLDELMQRVSAGSWYLSAADALRLQLIGGIV